MFWHCREWVRVGEPFNGAKLLLVSQLGRRCQLGFRGLNFAPGLIGVGFSWQKMCIMVDMIHMIHINESLFYISRGSHMVVRWSREPRLNHYTKR